MNHTVLISWDPEAGLWTATSKDINGLALEDISLDALTEQIRSIAPQLVGLKHQDQCDDLQFIYEGPNCR